MRIIWALQKNGELLQAKPSEVTLLLQEGASLWIDVTQPTTSDFAWLTEVFSFHPLAIEDAQTPPLHPKLDEYPNYLFMLAHGVHPQATPKQYKPIQSAFFLGERFLVSIYPAEAAELNTKPEVVGPLLAQGVAHLLSQLLSRFVVDFTPFVTHFGEELEHVEDLLEENSEQILDDTLAFKRSLSHLRQTAIHQRELLSRLSHHKKPELSQEHPFIQDINDRITLLLDEVTALRELVASILESHAAVSSHRSAAVMKILTAVSTIFFPLTFVVSLYGMNFRHTSAFNMPELLWHDGYPVVLAVMIFLTMMMLYVFRKKDWI
jgi:magnesium transporter